ncbi:MAG: amidase, partial [Terracidiphilus sp.]
MSKSRREFLANMSVPLFAAAAFQAEPQQQKTARPPAGAPPAFGTSPAVGPIVSSETFTEAEKLVQVEMTPH